MERYSGQNVAYRKAQTSINNTNQVAVPVHSLIRQPVRAVSQQSVSTIVTRQQVPVVNSDPVLIVMEIRMGLRKFETTSHNSKVTFQDDGIMFHVKIDEGEFSPVLINTKSIIRITLNLQGPIKVMFIHLESSSIRQLKDIFKLDNEEFGDNHKSELRKCLVFVLSSSEISLQSKNQIIAKCNVMKNRFKRQDDLLTFISPSQALDIIFQTEGDFNSWIKTCATLSQVTTTYQSVSTISRPAQMAIAVNNPRISTPTVVQQKDIASVVVTSANSNSGPKLPTSIVSSQPEIILPNNQAERQKILSDLSQNGVYRVRDNGDSYIGLWNGASFTKCNWYVEACKLEMQEVHIGSATIKCNEKDEFKISGNMLNLSFIQDNKKKSIECSMKDIVSTKISFEMSCLVIEFGPIAMDKIRELLKMEYGSEPYYGKVTENEKHKYFLICLKQLREKRTQAILNLKQRDDRPVVQEMSKEQACRALKLMHDNDSSQMDIEDDDDLILCDSEIGIKCPISLQNMREPVMNMICQHNYEKYAIHSHIKRKPNAARCPATGCGNSIPVTENLLQDNIELKHYIQRMKTQKS